MTRALRGVPVPARSARSHRPTRHRRLTVCGLAALLTVLAWVFLAPPELGGQTDYVVTRGISMAPAFSTGDLAVVRQRSSYDVGDVVAYHSPTLGIVVLHRIITAEPDGFRTRGDNNGWADPDVVPADQIIGRLWLHVPRIGSALPHAGAVPVLLIGAALPAARAVAGTRRRRRRPSRKVPAVHRNPRHRPASALLTAAVVAVVCGVTLLLISARAPAAPEASAAGTLDHALDLTYRAPADGAVYQGGELVTGDPVFLRLNPLIDVLVHDHVSGGRATPPARTLSLQARLSGANGWQYSLPLGGEAVRRGTDSELHVAVDLRSLQGVIIQAQARTGTGSGSGSHRLELVPALLPAGPATDSAGSIEFPPIVFSLEADQLVLDGGQQQRGAPVTRTASEPAGGTVDAGERLLVAGVSMAAWPLRTAGVGVLLLGSLLAGIGLVRRSGDPLARLPQPPITLSGHDLPIAAVETASLDELVGLAQRYDRPVLVLPGSSRSVYLVEEAGTWYRHTRPEGQPRYRGASRLGRESPRSDLGSEEPS
jgi:signal peptidase I